MEKYRKIFVTISVLYLQTKSTRQELRKQAEGMVKNMRKMVLVVTRSYLLTTKAGLCGE